MKTFTITTTFNSPILSVWNAFTNAELLKQWWSPDGMKSSFLTVDLRVGGVFRFCFKGDDRTEMAGKEFWGRGEYTEIEKPFKISYYDSFSDKDGNLVPPSYYGMPGKNEIEQLLMEFTFKEEGSNTLMMLVGENSYDDSMTENLKKGWNSMFDKLTLILQE